MAKSILLKFEIWKTALQLRFEHSGIYIVCRGDRQNCAQEYGPASFALKRLRSGQDPFDSSDEIVTQKRLGQPSRNSFAFGFFAFGGLAF